MRNLLKSVAASALIVALAGTQASAQGALIGTERVDDRITDIEDRVRDDMARAEDRARFGNEQFAPGWTGSLALGLNAAYGNSDNREFSLAGRFRYNQGQWSHTFGFGFEQNRSGGVRNQDQAFALYDANYYFDQNIYGFGLGRVENDRLADIQDGVLGVGLGYRVINTPDAAWRLQAGPALRTNRTAGARNNEVAAIAGSRGFVRLSEGVFLTSDTDLIHSRNAGTRAINDLGVTVSMTDALSTRVSLRTDWTDNPAPGNRRHDHRVGVSLVYSFR